MFIGEKVFVRRRFGELGPASGELGGDGLICRYRSSGSMSNESCVLCVVGGSGCAGGISSRFDSEADE